MTTPAQPDERKARSVVEGNRRQPFRPIVTRRLFLSCVSHEFRAYRDALASYLAQPGVELRRQEDFINLGRTTLEKLNDYIHTCDAVIHLVGHGTGTYPAIAEVEALLDQIPDFISKLSLGELFECPGLSYTQWEAWLALYHGKPLALYRAADIAQRESGFSHDPLQRKRQELHWNALISRGRDRKEFVSPHDLSIEVLRSMPLLVPGFSENVRRGDFRDRNLLFAVLALQDAILSREAFVRVCKAWAEDTDQLIADVMQQDGLLTPEDRLLVEARLERKLKTGDIRQSLAECLGTNARNSLGEALDPSIIASLPDRLAGWSGLQSSSGRWRYKLTRTQGVGGLGIVSIAEDVMLDRNVAVKCLRPERLIDTMAVERFIREAKITGRLQHPNIVPIYELGLTPDDQIPFYSMRFVGHRTLRGAIVEHHSDTSARSTERNLRFRSLIQSFVAVCNAVAFAHEQQIIHRDIKPANIMIGDFGEVILLDWGLAARLDEEPAASVESTSDSSPISVSEKTQSGVRLGTPAYMAPEQAAGRIDLHGTHTDIYGLGVTLYEILTGDVPFTGTSTADLLSAIQNNEIPNPRERNPLVEPSLAAICFKSLEKRPADRYVTVNALADDVKHWLADEPVAACADTAGERLSRFVRKHRGYVWTSGAAMAVIALVPLVYALFVLGQTERLVDEQNRIAGRLMVMPIVLEHHWKWSERGDALAPEFVQIIDSMTKELSPIDVGDYKRELLKSTSGDPQKSPNDQADFEALHELAQGRMERSRTVVNDEGKREFQYYGAVRATASCITCHLQQGQDISEGDLIGMAKVTFPMTATEKAHSFNKMVTLTTAIIAAFVGMLLMSFVAWFLIHRDRRVASTPVADRER